MCCNMSKMCYNVSHMCVKMCYNLSKMSRSSRSFCWGRCYDVWFPFIGETCRRNTTLRLQAAATNRTAVNETLRLSSNIFRFSSYLISQSWSKFIFRIANKHQLQNLNQTSTFWLNLSFKILTKPSFRILTLDQDSTW